MTVQDEYVFYQNKYEKMYGKNCIVLMQVGSFHECYSFGDTPDLAKISEILDLTLTKKNKKEPLSKKNPLLVGFPSVALDKYVKKLVLNGYTVPVYDQITPPPDPKRGLVNIYSPGTYIEENFTQDSNNTMCVYIEDEHQTDGTFIMCIGICVTDVSTGKVTMYETISKKTDKNLACDDTVRFINTYNPKELIVNRKKILKSVDTTNYQTKDDVINFLELNDRNYRYSENIDKKWYKKSFQEAFLKDIYKESGIYDTVIEFLDLERKPYCLMSTVLLLEFIKTHNENLLNRIRKPEFYEDSKHLILGNNAINQLNIVRSEISSSTDSKFKSLFDVVNRTATPMGRRYLKDRICNPLIDDKILTKSYDTIETIKNRYIKRFQTLITGIIDVERLHRRITIGSIHPHEFCEFIKSYKKIDELMLFASGCKDLNGIVDKDTVKKLKEFIKIIDKTFDYDRLEMYKQNTIEESIFKKGIFEKIDSLQEKIDENRSFMNSICSVLSSHIKDSGKIIKTDDKLKIRLENTKSEGYYLKTTNIRAKSLKNEISKLKSIKVTEKLNIDPTKLKYKEQKGGTTIIYDDLDRISTDTQKLTELVFTEVLETYKATLKNIVEKYNNMFSLISDKIGEIDFYLSCAKTAEEYNYCKPVIDSRDFGYIEAEDLRHPIIERITEAEYVPHNIDIGTKKKTSIDGMLIFGLNSSGKSSLMKATGLSVVMAQSGMFVPAKKYKISPFNSLFARITGNDNIFKGLSSFALEMVELDAILKRNNKKTLVIGDEVCRGTESISGNAIVASAIVQLAEAQTPFMFATHLHEIPKIDEIKDLKNVKSYHLSVSIDPKTNKLVFDRKLKDGPGENVYGITVAKHIISDTSFIDRAEKIRNRLSGKHTFETTKISRYNSKVVMDRCQICNKHIKSKYEVPLDTHHINYQKDCKNGFVENKPHLKMNAKANLAVLCKKCHTDEHNGVLKIKGYKKTSSGIELDYERNTIS